MTVGALHRRSTMAVALLAAFGVLTGSALLAVAGSALVLSTLIGFQSYYDRERSTLRTWITHALTLVALVFAIITFPTSRIDAVILILMLGIFNRVMLRAGHRDDLLVIGASCVLIAAATIITPGLGFGVIALLFVPAVVWSLWTSMLLGSAEQRAQSHHAAMLGRPVPKRMTRIAAAALGLTVAGFALVSVLPRFRFAPFLSAGAFAAMPGASDTMGLQTGGLSPREDRTVVLRVRPAEDVTVGDLEGLYARLYVLDLFDGKTWGRSTEGHFRHARDWDPTPVEAAPKVHIDVARTLRRGHQAMPVLGRRGPSHTDDRRVHQDMSGTWVMDGWAGRTYGYYLWIDAPPRPPQLAPRFEALRAEHALALPDDLDPRIRQLAVRLTGGLADDRSKVDAVLGHFGRGYEYSLEPLQGQAADPLVRFIFEAKKGHCELYAGAVAVLLRAAGVPARVATGYYSGVINELGGFLTFAEQDAHAWVEAKVDGEGWRWVDATPPDLRVTRPAASWLSRIRDVYDLIDAAWYDYVVDFDSARTRNLFASVAWKLRDGTLGAADLVPLAKKVAGDGGGVVVIVVLLLMLFGTPVLVLQRRKDPRILGTRLRRALGAAKGDNRTLQVLLDAVPEHARLDAAAAVRVYEQLRFGGRSELYAPARRHVRTFERTLRRGTGAAH